jgi:hypothetical protein
MLFVPKKTTWNKTPKRVIDIDYLIWLAHKPCIVCGSCDVEIHHVKTKTLKQRDDDRTVPLCPEHHRGNGSVHKNPQMHDKELLLKVAARFRAEYEERK